MNIKLEFCWQHAPSKDEAAYQEAPHVLPNIVPYNTLTQIHVAHMCVTFFNNIYYPLKYNFSP